jgi:predicted PurR-regulated permease PerM
MPHTTTAFEIVWRNPWVRALCYVVLIIFVIWVLWVLRGGYSFALQVGLIGFVLAYILNPVVNLFQRLRIRRSIAVLLIYILVVNLLVLSSILITNVVGELGRFVTLLPTAFDEISGVIAGISEWVNARLELLPGFLSDLAGEPGNEEFGTEVQTQFQLLFADAITTINTFLRTLLQQGPTLLVTGATTIISTTFQVFLILLASAYFLYDFPRFIASFRRIVPIRWRPLYSDISRKTDKAVGGYLRGQLLITIFLGIFVFIGLSIVGIPLALAISFLAAIFNLIPYLGPIIGTVPAVILGFTVSPWAAFWAVIVFIIANQIEANILAPWILAKSTNLHPVTVLISLLIGAGLLGLLGALLAVPIAALLKVILEDYLFNRPAYQEVSVVPPAVTEPPDDAQPSRQL